MSQTRQPPTFGIAIVISLVLWAIIFGAASVAFGQTTTSGAASNSRADAGALSDSRSGAQINQTFQGAPASSRAEIVNSGRTQNDVAYSGTTTNNVNSNVSGTTTLRNVPAIYAPSFGGTNPCAVSASAGGAVAGFGITLGGSWASAECERRNLAVIAVQALNDPALAQEILCGTTDFRAARLRMGMPCAEDRPVAAATVVASVPPPATPVSFQRRAVPDWCATVGPRDPPASRAACQ